MAWPRRLIPFSGTVATNPETTRVFEAAAAGRLIVPKCGACGRSHWYPRAICPFCFSQDLAWNEASGNAVIYSFSVMKRAEIAYAIAYVTLAEGPTMLTNIVGCDPDSIQIGQMVKLTFVPSEGGPPMPMFTPA